ncbi:hypothetical protein AVEN_121250-1 [Araneus ventricosus]|uniref:Uncharacterized protein n=1 Tax=Araneus ventricosus TaxID=182803 RepID=A0A4Y2KXV1_ARAVE|nr:hypothetical protein AVEN_121250-1 [Araneus ventricosus]
MELPEKQIINEEKVAFAVHHRFQRERQRVHLNKSNQTNITCRPAARDTSLCDRRKPFRSTGHSPEGEPLVWRGSLERGCHLRFRPGHLAEVQN